MRGGLSAFIVAMKCKMQLKSNENNENGNTTDGRLTQAMDVKQTFDFIKLEDIVLPTPGH